VSADSAPQALLADTAMFAGAPPSALDRLASRCVERSFDRREFVFLEGDTGDAMYVVVSGLVQLVVTSPAGDAVSFGTVRPGGTFGEISAIDGGPRSAAARALQATRVLALPTTALREAMRAEPELGHAVLLAVAGRLRATSRQHADFVFLDLPGRIARYLLDHAHGSSPATVTLDLSQGELATLVGGTRQSVNLVLRDFEREGLVRRRGQTLELLVPDALSERAAAMAL
jgi:CRP-like cAMP-binding protein